jgi:hypothetical protein
MGESALLGGLPNCLAVALEMNWRSLSSLTSPSLPSSTLWVGLVVGVGVVIGVAAVERVTRGIRGLGAMDSLLFFFFSFDRGRWFSASALDGLVTAGGGLAISPSE